MLWASFTFTFKVDRQELRAIVACQRSFFSNLWVSVMCKWCKFAYFLFFVIYILCSKWQPSFIYMCGVSEFRLTVEMTNWIISPDPTGVNYPYLGLVSPIGSDQVFWICMQRLLCCTRHVRWVDFLWCNNVWIIISELQVELIALNNFVRTGFSVFLTYLLLLFGIAFGQLCAAYSYPPPETRPWPRGSRVHGWWLHAGLGL